MIDVAIIGSGPAGLSAAINCLQRNKVVTVFGRGIESSILYPAENVDNYLGMSNLSGPEMLQSFYDHAMKKGVSFHTGMVSQILCMGEYYMLNVENTFIETKAIILATGIGKSKAIPGEQEYLGKGVSYCATCDGMLYKGKTVTVVGENTEAEEDVKFLSELCKEVLYLPLYEDVAPQPDNVKIISGKPVSVKGEEKVTGLETKEGFIDCDGIFFMKNTIPMTSLLYGLNMDKGHILVDRRMETNLPFVYAAGDCTGTPYQVSKAVGEGLIAALSVAVDLSKRDFAKKQDK